MQNFENKTTFLSLVFFNRFLNNLAKNVGEKDQNLIIEKKLKVY
jgi:predicted P-loop ATPase